MTDVPRFLDRERVPPGTSIWAQHANDITECPWSPTSDDPMERAAWRRWQHVWANVRRPELEGTEAEDRAVNTARAYGLTGRFISGGEFWANGLDRRPPDPVDDLLANPNYDAYAEVADAFNEGLAIVGTAWASIKEIAAVATTAWNDLTDELRDWVTTDEPVRMIRGKPAGRVKSCHHGNERGRCPTCSGVGTPSPRNHLK